MELHRNLDPLENLSFFKDQCLVCGRLVVEAIEEDVPESWAVCRCGHVFPCKNRVRWH